MPLRRSANVCTVVGTPGRQPAGCLRLATPTAPATVRLQHPLGVAYHDGKLYVADTYNHKIKAVDPATGHTSTIAGTGKPAQRPTPPAFDQPAASPHAAGKLYVADTNNHPIRTIDLANENRVATLEITGLAPPAKMAAAKKSESGEYSAGVDSAIGKPVSEIVSS